MNIKEAKQEVVNTVQAYLKKDEKLKPFDISAYLDML